MTTRVVIHLEQLAELQSVKDKQITQSPVSGAKNFTTLLNLISSIQPITKMKRCSIRQIHDNVEN